MAEKEVVSVSTIPRSGTQFEVEDKINGGKKTYTVLPLLLKEVDEFLKERINAVYSVFNLIDVEAKKNLDGWLKRKVRDKEGKAVDLERAMADGWDLADLTECIGMMIKLSG